MVKVKGGKGSGRGLPRTTGRSSRSAGEEAIESAFGALVPLGLKTIGQYGEGVMGAKTAFKRQLQRLKNNAKTVVTGHRYDMKGQRAAKDNDMRWFSPRQVTNRIGGAMGLPWNVLVGGAAQTAGMATRAAIGVPLMATKAIARPGMRAAGMMTYETARVGGQIVNGGVKTLRAPLAMDIAMAGTFVGGTAIGLGMAINEVGGGNKNFNGYASGLTGTLGTAATPLVDTGANGDLVFAMHKMR